MVPQIVGYLRDAGWTVYDTYVPDTMTAGGEVIDGADYPYVLIEAAANSQRIYRVLAGGRAGQRLRLTVTVAGKSPASVRGLAPVIRRLLEAYPVAGGGEVRYLDGQLLPVTLDSDHNRRVFYTVDFYELLIPNFKENN